MAPQSAVLYTRGMGQEFEIKFVGAQADIAALRRSPAIEALRRDAPCRERLVTTYYDAPDGALAAAGLSLRLREEAGALVQAVKTQARTDAPFLRGEEEVVLSSREAFPALSNGLDRLVEPAALAPVARTVVDRWTAQLEKNGARIEAGFDLGRVETFRDGKVAAAAPLAEAELELVEGDARALFALARLCLKEGEGRLRLCRASKEERARGLLDSPAPPRARLALDYEADVTVAQMFAQALASAGLRLIDLAPSVLDLRLPEGVHQTRVALRQIRVLVRLHEEAFGTDELARLGRRARRLARALGPARDWDVFLAESLPSARDAAGGGKGFDRLQSRAESLRARAWEDAARVVAAPRYGRLALDLIEAGAAAAARADQAAATPAPIFAARALQSRLDAARMIADAPDAADPLRRHALRIALKKLRYAAHVFRPVYPPTDRKPFMAAMSALQDGLGALNDAVVAQALSARAAKGRGGAASRAAGFVCGWRAAEAEAARAAIDESWRALEAAPVFWRKLAGAAP